MKKILVTLLFLFMCGIAHSQFVTDVEKVKPSSEMIVNPTQTYPYSFIFKSKGLYLLCLKTDNRYEHRGILFCLGETSDEAIHTLKDFIKVIENASKDPKKYSDGYNEIYVGKLKSDQVIIKQSDIAGVHTLTLKEVNHLIKKFNEALK